MNEIEDTQNPSDVKRPVVFLYNDYRVYLKDLFRFMKATRSRFSMRGLAKRADLASGYLPMVLAGRRPLSAVALEKLIILLELNANEKAFLEHLVQFQNANSSGMRVLALERLVHFRIFQEFLRKEAEISEFLAHWYYVAIRELAELPGFCAEAGWVQNQMRNSITLKEAQEALDFLFRTGFLVTGPDGRIHLPDRSIECHGDRYRPALAEFHRQILARASESIEKTPSSERNIQGHTCALGPENFVIAKQIVEKAISDIRRLGQGEQKPKRVYQFEIALFPLSQPTQNDHK